MNIAVYCSAKDRIAEDYLALGDLLGEWLAREGHTLVYGGATGGLMTRVSAAAKGHGGRVVGVVTRRIAASGRQAECCDELLTVETMCARKEQMRAIADCFVCLPGSYGTLDEMMDVIASGTVGEHRKPIYIVNYLGFYNDLRRQADYMRAQAFLPQQESYAPVFVDSLQELFRLLSL